MRKRLFCLVWTIIALASATLAQEGFYVQVGELYYWIQEIGPSVTMEGGPYAMVTYHDEYSETEPENSYEGLTVVNIPETITVEGVVYPVKSIGWRAFVNCSSLTSVTIGNNVTNIAEQAFYGCSSLTNITIPNNVTHIAHNAFSECSSLPVINNLRYAGTYLIEAIDKSLSTYIIREGTTWIGAAAFSSCNNLVSVIIPNSVTAIGERAFSLCYNLTSITLPNGIKEIETSTFYGCIGLTSITIPSSVTTISIDALSGCTGLNSIIIEQGNSTYDSRNNCNAIIETATNTLIIGCHNTTIPNSVTSIGSYAFSGCSSLTSIKIPNSVTIIERSAFDGCGLTSIEIPNSVTEIAWAAFEHCSNLTTVILGKGIIDIGGYAFNKCNLSTIIIYATTPPQMHEASFGWSPKTITAYVPPFCLDAYKKAEGWNTLNIQIKPEELIISPTTCVISFEQDEMVVSIGIEGGETFEGNMLEYNGLEPNSEHNYSVVLISNTGQTETVNVSFTTTALELITQPSKPVSSTTAILLANTNMADIETSCGFEWKRNDAPADMDGTKAYCPVANGTMAGRLKGLNENTYYKYRAFYQSSAGNMYYGDWQYIFTGDNIVEFEPILYTYEAVSVKENEATLKGYALAGSDDFTEQGFEYWAESRVQQEGRMARRVSAALGEHKTITASGISMKATLTGLDAGTVYKYRTYAKLGNQTIYGSEMSFTTKGEYTGSEDINNIPCTPVVSSRKILHNGQILILRGDKTYTTDGRLVR